MDRHKELHEEVERLKSALHYACEDLAEDHTHLQNLCLKVGIPRDQVEGDSYGQPSVMDLADMLAAKIEFLRAALHEIRATAHCIAKAGPLNTPTLEDAWGKFMALDRMAADALSRQ